MRKWARPLHPSGNDRVAIAMFSMKASSETTLSALNDGSSPSKRGPAARDGGPTMDMRVETLGKYHSIAALGSGGMSKVHLAVVRGPAGFHKLVVLKELRANLSHSDEYLPMFLDEARLAARLNHPNVVQTNEVGESGDAHFIAMEYLDGQPLGNILRRTNAAGGLPLPFALRIVADACAGLHHAHELRDFDGSALNVVHRDVSPQNIFVTYDGQTKIVDFGVAKAEGRAVQTRVGVLKGKVRYMAPEQARGEHVDRRADVFALGVVLYEAVARQRLWRDKQVETLRELRADRIPSSPKEVRGDLPDAVDRICRRALSPSPGERYATVLEMQGDLEQCLETMTPHTTPRALGELVSSLFGQERQQIHAVIEQQLRRLELIASGDASSRLSIPALTLGGGSIAPSSPSDVSDPFLRAASRKRRTATVVLGALLVLLVAVSFAVWRSPAEVVSPKNAPWVDPAALAGPSAPAAASMTLPPAAEELASSRAKEPRVPEASVRVPRKSSLAAAAEQSAPHVPPPQPRVHVREADDDDPLADRK